MTKFICKEDFWEMFPDVTIGTVICHNIKNEYKDNQDKAQYEQMIRDGEQKALTYLGEDVFSDNKVIKVWREAYFKFKTKKGARCAIEALMKRISKENHLSTINPLVDIYNSVSLSHGMPCGGEDLDSVKGDILLTKADGHEKFYVIGSEENDPPYPGELVYKDDEGAMCRCWTWREAGRTMLTEKTQNAILVCELVDPSRYDDFIDVLESMKREVENRLGATCQIKLFTVDHKEDNI